MIKFQLYDEKSYSYVDRSRTNNTPASGYGDGIWEIPDDKPVILEIVESDKYKKLYNDNSITLPVHRRTIRLIRKNELEKEYRFLYEDNPSFFRSTHKSFTHQIEDRSAPNRPKESGEAFYTWSKDIDGISKRLLYSVHSPIDRGDHYEVLVYLISCDEHAESKATRSSGMIGRTDHKKRK